METHAPHALHTPSPPPSESTKPSLPSQINSATRSSHTHLNRLITSRLPLALPPHSSAPNVYALGLRAFAQIYFAFEASWLDLIAVQSAGEEQWINVWGYEEEIRRRRAEAHLRGDREEAEDSDSGEGKGRSEGMMQALADLLPKGLMRSHRLEQDLEYLGVEVVHLEGLGQNKSVEEFVKHIRTVTAEKPWTLVAYAWVMYMAIFSGGRWIRQQLLDAGPDFWGHAQDAEAMQGVEFLHFDGEEDGEDIKAEFKRRLADAENVFDEQQREDVIAEAQEIFRRCVEMVEELDETCTGMEKEEGLEEGTSTNIIKKAVEEVEVLRHTQSPLSTPFITGLAVVVGCVSWYAYDAGLWL
ncbi:MAG: heme oxygenase [Bogoriella megaspora]|nr:MAG: heme oxygenase [Bogoriella megaspora]